MINATTAKKIIPFFLVCIMACEYVYIISDWDRLKIS